MSFPPLWAVHIADGVLDWPWLAGGFALIGVLALIASWRVREEEIPRIALLTAAFFVASSIHVKLGFSSAHLLLNGLVGVILGRRAPLAILLGVTMQALLLAHGGVSTIGVNACTEALPALLAGGMFPVLYALTCGRHTWMRSVLVAASAVLLGSCLVFAVTLLATNPLRGMIQWHEQAGLMISLDHLDPARRILLHPATLAGLAAVAAIAVVVERRRRPEPEFVLGAFLGVVSVMTTALLASLVLLADGADRWNTIVSALIVLHQPIALVEGVILGCTLGFLARVKPEMLAVHTPVQEIIANDEAPSFVSQPADHSPIPLPGRQTGVMFLLALGTMLLAAGPVHAHRLQAECTNIDRINRRVTVESWYETDEFPHEARVQVLRTDGSILAEGPLDAKGAFIFAYQKAEPLTVQIDAPGGHRATCKIPAAELEGVASTETAGATTQHRGTGPARAEGRFVELVAGVAMLLAAAAFVMSWSNHRRLRRLE
jgi:cobalt/nickel transport system permease protein